MDLKRRKGKCGIQVAFQKVKSTQYNFSLVNFFQKYRWALNMEVRSADPLQNWKSICNSDSPKT